MIRRIIAGVALSFVAAAGAHAQGITKAQLDSARAAAADVRKQTVAANMLLDSITAKKFWPVYDKYRAALMKARNQEWSMLAKLATGADSLTNKQATALTNTWMSAQVAELKVMQQYVPKFQAVMTPKQVARFYQIEHRMDLLVQVAVAQEIPLIY
jgi:hypothetical protein